MTQAFSVLMGLVEAYTDLPRDQNWLKSKLSQPDNGWHYSVFFFSFSNIPMGIFFGTKFQHIPNIKYAVTVSFFFFPPRFYANCQIMLKDDFSQEWG